MQMWSLGASLSAGLGSVRLTIELNDLKDLFQLKSFCDSMVGSTDASSTPRNLLAAWLAGFCFNPHSDPFHFMGMFVRLRLHFFSTVQYS